MQGSSDSESTQVPTGLQAVSLADPNLAHNKDNDDWKRVHFITYIKEGLKKKKSPTKPLNYSKLSGVTQEKKENPTAFLERFREALRKHTCLDADSPVGQLILKDKFTTKSATDTWRKLQKLVFCPNMDLECILGAATTVFFKRDQEGCKEKERRDKRNAKGFIMALP